jgi:hypothetical protein
MTGQVHRGGRKSKGDRQALISRVPTPLADVVKAEADRRGMSLSDFIAASLAGTVGQPQLAPLSPAVPLYEELPITAVA